MQSRRAKLVVASAIVVVVFSFIMIVTRGDHRRDLVLQIEPVDSSGDVTVYVGGAVEEPGLYALPRGSRVAEALDLAGLAESSETSSLELASVLEDEQTITVPERQEVAAPEVSNVDTQPESSSSDLIDINQASESELAELPGVGPVLAGRIRERRLHEGPYQTLDELSEISGISSRMVDEIRGYANVGP